MSDGPVECDYDGCNRTFHNSHAANIHAAQTHNTDRPWQDKDRLRELYVEQKMGAEAIGELLGCSDYTIFTWLSKHEIETRKPTRERLPKLRTRKDGYELWHIAWSGKQKNVLHHRLLAVAEFGMEKVRGSVVHHKNLIPWDNRPNNIEVMSREDHTAHHYSREDMVRLPNGDFANPVEVRR